MKTCKKQRNQLEKNFINCLYYWNEKYYGNGFTERLNCYKSSTINLYKYENKI